MADTPLDTTIQVGEVIRAEPFTESRKPKMAKLWIDVGTEVVQSAAQTGYHYAPDELVGTQVLCATDLGSMRIAGFRSEALTVGVPDEEGHPILVQPTQDAPLGGMLY